MYFDPPLIQATLLKRYKRFLADVRLADGTELTAHCPNPGAMTACAEPGWKVALSLSPNPRRKLPYTLEMTHNGTTWIGVNTQQANPLVEQALKEEMIPELLGYPEWQREVPFGEKSRVDFLLKKADEHCYLEVKSVSLIQGKTYLFPDSKTSRGKKHIEELVSMKQAGHRAVLLFVVQREDGNHFSPASAIDPAYVQALKQGLDQGLEVLVYQSKISPEAWFLSHALSWSLS